MSYKHKGYFMAFCLIPIALVITILNTKIGVALTIIAVSLPFIFPYTRMQTCPYCGHKDISVTPQDDHKTCPACQKKCIVKNGDLLKIIVD